LVCTKVDDLIQLDPHAMGLCVLVLNERPRPNCSMCLGSGWGEVGSVRRGLERPRR
jgi:hypothetical protein